MNATENIRPAFVIGHVDVQGFSVPYTRKGDVLEIDMSVHVPHLFEHVTSKLGLTIDGTVTHVMRAEPIGFGIGELQKRYTASARIANWTQNASIQWPTSTSQDIRVQLPTGCRVGFGEANGCEHSWELRELFTSSYYECRKCGKER